MLIQLSTVKTRLKIAEADVNDDVYLNEAITAVGERLARECNRTFDYSATATYDFRGDTMDIMVDRYPIVSVASFSLKTTEADGFVAQSPTPDYIVNGPRNIIELASCLGSSRELGRVTFAGGYVVPGGTVGAGQTALPEEIVRAVEMQVVYLYQNRDRLGVSSISGEGGSVSKDVAVADNLLPEMISVIRKYQRWLN